MQVPAQGQRFGVVSRLSYHNACRLLCAGAVLGLCGVEPAWSGIALSGRESLYRAATPEIDARTAPKAFQKLLQEAAALFERGKTTDALRQLESFSQQAADAPPAKLILARFHLAAGQPQAARPLLEEAARVTPGYAGTYLTFGRLALVEGRLTDAQAQFELARKKARQVGKDHESRFVPLLLDGLAAVAAKRGDWSVAVQNLESLVAVRAADAGARQRLASAYFHVGNRDAASRELREASRLDASLPPSELSLAQLYEQAGERESADRSISDAVERFPSDQRVRTAQASLLLRRERFAEAGQIATLAAGLGPESRDARYIAGLAARFSKDFASAVAQFQKLYDEAPDDLETLNQLALCLAESDSSESQQKALSYAVSFARQSPQNRNAYATLGWCQYRLGQLAEARQSLASAISGGQGPAVAGYYLACVLRDLKEPEAIPELLESADNAEDPFLYRQEVKRWREELKIANDSENRPTALAK